MKNNNFYCSILKKIITNGIKIEDKTKEITMGLRKNIITNRILFLCKILHDSQAAHKNFPLDIVPDKEFIRYLMDFIYILGTKIGSISKLQTIFLHTINMVCDQSNLSLFVVFVNDFIDFQDGMEIFTNNFSHFRINPSISSIFYIYRRANLLGGLKIWTKGKFIDNSLEKQINNALSQIKVECLDKMLQQY